MSAISDFRGTVYSRHHPVTYGTPDMSKSHSVGSDALVSVVVPTYNASPERLQKTLDSISEQTLAKRFFEILIVDDATDRPESRMYLQSLAELESYGGVTLRMIRHDTNLWLAEARNTGARSTTLPYLVFLDDDDLIAPDYLEKCLVLLAATPQADWVYTNVLKFDQRNELRKADGFNFLRFFLKNEMPYSAMFRTDVWERAGQREIQIPTGKRTFEDWDMYMRLMSRGSFGTPLSDTTFYYRKSPQSVAARSVREYIASVYVNYRMHFWRLPALPLGHLKYRRFFRRGHCRLSVFHPVRYLNYIFEYLVKRYLRLREMPALLDARATFNAVFRPKRFLSHVLHDPSTFSLAAIRCGFSASPDMSFIHDRDFPRAEPSNTLLAGHTWWQMGGAELIYLEWLKTARNAGADKLVDVVGVSDDELDVLRQDFGEYSDTQYALDRFGETPLQRLRSLWNLICLEHPRLIFVSGNPYLYFLLPYIKEQFPDIRIIDILHNEFDGVIDWFSISSDYTEFIDCRVVTSEYWKQVLVDKYGVDPGKIEVTGNPVDTKLYDPDRHDAKKIRRSMGLDTDKRVVSFVGRLHDQKGLDVFFTLVDLMSGDLDYHFVIAGDGEFREAVIRFAKDRPNLSFLGYFRTVEKVLAMSDVLVCPSRYEGVPLIGLEAAAMNTGLISTNVVGFREQLSDGGFGLYYDASMVPTQDAATIRAILLNKFDMLGDLGKNGRSYVVGRNSRERVARDYRQVLGRFMA